MGYSTGTDTIRQMPNACPRIYVAGPGWQDKITGEPITAPPPEGPSLVILATPDAEMDRFAFDGDYAAAATGFAVPDARTTVAASRVAQPGPKYLRVDFAGAAHGSFHPPFAASEDRRGRRSCAASTCGTSSAPVATRPRPSSRERTPATVVCDWPWRRYCGSSRQRHRCSESFLCSRRRPRLALALGT